LLRATQEALSNIRKHAQAKKAAVTLSYMDDVVVLDVQDDGVGLNGAGGKWHVTEEAGDFGSTLPRRPEIGRLGDSGVGGFGLRAMRERVTMLNGSLLMESTPGEGTTLVVEIPTGQVASDN
jgi:signal transduction histidine kinase